MEAIVIKNFKELFGLISDLKSNLDLTSESRVNLFRGQNGDFPLLPSIARFSPKRNTSKLENAMLAEFKRRIRLMSSFQFECEWDLLVYAQHFGMKTRLLDWTTNPLIAIWFACSNTLKRTDRFLYILNHSENLILENKDTISPFDIANVKVIIPNLNNERIIAQSGWFTAHHYSEDLNQFVPLEENKLIAKNLLKILIPKNLTGDILEELNILGVNHNHIFPDVEGLCNHINWRFERILDSDRIRTVKQIKAKFGDIVTEFRLDEKILERVENFSRKDDNEPINPEDLNYIFT